jgi:effector-binding domain-containing protein
VESAPPILSFDGWRIEAGPKNLRVRLDRLIGQAAPKILQNSKTREIMSYEFDIVEVAPVTLAVCEIFTKQQEIPARITEMFDTVYTWLRESSVKQVGNNYAIYDQFGSDGMRMRVGFPVSESFDSSSLVRCLELGAAKAAHTRHRGPYSSLPRAHVELNKWCTRQSLIRGEFSWEKYGDWHDDPSKLVTDIYIRLI